MKALEKYLRCQQTMAVIKTLENFFKNIPHLPKAWVEFLVKIIPYLVIIGVILNILGALSALSLVSGLNMMAQAINPFVQIPPVYFIISAIFSILAAGLGILAYSPLKNRAEMGWIYLFWLNILGIVQNIVGIFYASTNVLAAVIGTLIGLYLLFEMKSSYKKA